MISGTWKTWYECDIFTYYHTYQLLWKLMRITTTNNILNFNISMWHSPFLDDDRSSAGQEILHILWNPHVR